MEDIHQHQSIRYIIGSSPKGLYTLTPKNPSYIAGNYQITSKEAIIYHCNAFKFDDEISSQDCASRVISENRNS